jgi:hypothetical protein
VLTGCSVREPNNARSRPPLPGGRPLPPPGRGARARRSLGLASAQAPIGAVGRDDRRRSRGRRRGRPSGRRAAAVARGTIARDRRSAPGCRSSTAATRRAPTASSRSAAGPSAAARSTRSSTRRGARRGRLPRGHAARPERQLVRPRPAAEAALRPRRCGALGGPPPRPRGRPGPRGADPRDRRPAHGRRRPAIPRLRFVTSHPWDLSDRLIAAMADCPSVCEHLHLPVQSGDDAVLRRMGRQYTIEHYLERLARIREAVPGIALSTDVIVGFCGETEEQFEATLGCSRRSATTRSSPPPIAAARARRPAARRRRPGRRQARASWNCSPPGGDRARAEQGLARAHGRGPRRRGRAAPQSRPRGAGGGERGRDALRGPGRLRAPPGGRRPSRGAQPREQARARRRAGRGARVRGPRGHRSRGALCTAGRRRPTEGR